ncbi:MAG TPA: hypothetical protein PLV55_06125 [Anaerohalosphaeraceae bacterium]|nr:hypothetical protein [Anaerohalosphaeraceae bacterium]
MTEEQIEMLLGKEVDLVISHPDFLMEITGVFYRTIEQDYAVECADAALDITSQALLHYGTVLLNTESDRPSVKLNYNPK